MMQLLKRYKYQAILVGAVLLTLVALVVVTLPGQKPETKNATLGEILGLGNRTAPGATANGSVTDSQIATYQEKLRKAGDPETYAQLGLAYLQKGREVGDPTYYTKAEGVLKKSLELDPNNVDALGGMGSLSLSRHQFAQGLEWGQKAQKLRPQTAYNYGVIADAQIELGRYDEATQTIQQMVDLRPDISSYARVSYIRELRGLYDGAIEAMKQAVGAGAPTIENQAWVIYQLGTLYFNRNKLELAETTYQNALNLFPNYVYAQAGMARIKAARGDVGGAITLMEQVTQRMPLPEFIIELGDFYTLNGKTDQANRQYELVRSIQKIYTENGVDTDLEMALFDADHENNLPEALKKAQQVYKIRPSIKAADALAWTLYKTGDYAAASEMSKQALRLGTQDSLMLYHAGMIALKQGKADEARPLIENALNLNPNFSFLYANEARKTLAELKGAVATK
jgi:tetratricopeptide (TPR) repeat protein